MNNNKLNFKAPAKREIPTFKAAVAPVRHINCSCVYCLNSKDTYK